MLKNNVRSLSEASHVVFYVFKYVSAELRLAFYAHIIRFRRDY